MTSFWRNLASPLSGPVLVFIAVSVPILWLIANGGLFSLPLALVFLAGFSAFAISTVDHLAHGSPVPVLAIESLNPTHEGRPLLAGILIGAALGGCNSAMRLLPVIAALPIVLIVLLILPASLALLCLDARRLTAFSPWHVGRLALRLGSAYGIYALVAGAYAAVLVGSWGRLTLVPYAVLAETAVLSLAAGLGGLLYDRRDKIGLRARIGPELEREEADRADARERERVLHEAYGSTRAKRVDAAWDVLSGWLRDRGDRLDDLEWLQERTALWPDKRISARLVREVVSRRLRRGDTNAALDYVDKWLAGGADYRTSSARELGRLVGLARLGGRNGLADRLLDACGAAYATDAEIAGLLARRAAMNSARRR
jgi:hypothetical protein